MVAVSSWSYLEVVVSSGLKIFVSKNPLLFLADYESALAPKTINTLSGTRKSEPLPIYLNLDILSFDKVDNLNMMFR